MKIKLTKLTKNRGKFVDCMARFSSIYMHSCEDLTETTGLLIAIIEQIESQKEEDILSSRSLLKKGLAIERLIESVICNKNITARELLVGDRNAILIAARSSAYGNIYSTNKRGKYDSEQMLETNTRQVKS